MNKQTLSGWWTLSNLGDGVSMPVAVPGSVYSAYLAEGKLPDPYWRDNEMQALALMDHDFLFMRTFRPDEELLGNVHQVLRFEGIDTVADVRLNGALLGHVENMHRAWNFDVTGLLRSGENVLEVQITSPTRYIAEKYARAKTDGSTDAMLGFSQLRKAHCMFGWDWGPRLPDAGIWREVSLLGFGAARLADVRVNQRHQGGAVEVTADVRLEGVGGQWEFSLKAPDGSLLRAAPGEAVIRVEAPEFWWPRGYGGQPLYTAMVALKDSSGAELDRWEARIGLRTMTVRNEVDEYGESFEFVVNGVPVFAMGADYIPEDNILSRVTSERTRALLEQCAQANLNSIRVWGGGYYPNDFFYDICDELGIVVWQDFMFACAVYEPSEAFTENICAEVIDNIRRIRHHASLGLWCGNNEMEWIMMRTDGYVYTEAQKEYYTELFERRIPELVREHDPATFYWPSSPSCGGGFDEPNNPDRGDVHYWDVWHSEKPFTDYRNYYFRFASEFGFQSLPSMKTIEAFTEPEDRNMFSYMMEKHQRNASANSRIISYMAQTFRYPERFPDVVYASQLLQAEAIKYGVEHWRRNRGRCMGAIYWQLNDCWPVISWASIDYFGRWKALHYYARRFFAPVLISCQEEGILTQEQNVNAQPPIEIRKGARLSVANETMDTFRGTARYALRDAAAGILRQGSMEVEVPPLSSLWLEAMDFGDAELYGNYVSFELAGQDGGIVSEGTALFCAPKHFRFADPKLSCSVEGNEILVKAEAYARCVEIDCAGSDMALSDNYFDMNAGEKRVRVLSGEPGDIRLKSVFNIGR